MEKTKIYTLNKPPLNKAGEPTDAQKMRTISKILNSDAPLKALHYKGILQNSLSNDFSDTLDNLYKIATTPRIQGIEAKIVLEEVISALLNPFKINQNFQKLTNAQKKAILSSHYTVLDTQTSGNFLENVKKYGTIIPKAHGSEKKMDIADSSVCVAAALEFMLASKYPAEFARWANELTSSDGQVIQKIKLESISPNTIEALSVLKDFKITPLKYNFNEAILPLKPDYNATLLAKIAANTPQEGKRSAVDLLIQSTLMNLGSNGTYNSILDTRKPNISAENKGLVELEKNVVESILFNRRIISITYQKIDSNQKLVGYECDFETTKRQITNALDAGESLVAGYVELDKNNKVESGHEIVIIGYTKQDGKIHFIYSDTDDNLSKPQTYSEDFLLKRLHHVGYPYELIKGEVEFVQNWREILTTIKKSPN